MNAAAASRAEDDPARAAAHARIRDLRARIARLDANAIDLILREARNHYRWTDRPVTEDDLKTIYDIARMGPTSMNSCPARFVFVVSDDARKRLASALNPYNVEKAMSAPATAIVAHDLEFWHRLPFLHPHDDRRHIFRDNAPHAETTAFRNGTLQGAYFIIAARALGFDVGAMSGFSNAKVDELFFAGTTLKSNFILNIGHADETAIFQRLPRLDFEEACSFA